MPPPEPFPEQGCTGAVVVTTYHWTLKPCSKSRRDPFCACSALSFTLPWETGAVQLPHVRLNTSLHHLYGSWYPTGCFRANLNFPARQTHPQSNGCPNPGLMHHKQGPSGVFPSILVILIPKFHDIHTLATFSTPQGSPPAFSVSFCPILVEAQLCPVIQDFFASHVGSIS